jgi:hypothetical protein
MHDQNLVNIVTFLSRQTTAREGPLGHFEGGLYEATK